MKKIVLTIMISQTLLFSWFLENKNYKFEQLTANVYVMHGPKEHPSVKNKGFMNNPALIIDKKGLIVIDPGSTYLVGKNILKEIKKISKKPIIAIFNTHIHGDHWLANQAIKEKFPKVNIYAHPNMIKQAKNGDGKKWINIMNKLTKGLAKNTKPTIPNISTKNMQTITIGEQKFTIHMPINVAHTHTDIMIEHINTKTLFTGDNAFVNRMGRYDNDASIFGNIKALEYAKNLKVSFSVPGHGPSGKNNFAITPYLNFLNTIVALVKKGYNEDKEDYEIKKDVINAAQKYKNWSGYSNGIGGIVSKAYLEVEEL